MIRIGIAGFGKIGQLRYQILSQHNGFQVVSILEKNPETAVPPGVFRAKTFKDLLDQDLDAVMICAFNDVLAEYTLKALKKNIHVFCEKPPARTVKELMKVSAQYLESKVVLKYGFNHRFHYCVIEAKRMISEGKFGKLISARGVYGKAGSIDYDKNWRNYKKVSGGGILIDQGIHMLDLLRYLSEDEFTVKHALVKTLFWNIEAEDNAFILLEGEKGAIASIHSSATQWKHKFLLELTFENGYINLDGILSGTRSYAPETIKYGLREFEDITWAMGKPQEHTIWFENDHSWQLEIEEFYNSIQGTQEVENGSIDDAVKTLSLVEAVYEYTS